MISSFQIYKTKIFSLCAVLWVVLTTAEMGKCLLSFSWLIFSPIMPPLKRWKHPMPPPFVCGGGEEHHFLIRKSFFSMPRFIFDTLYHQIQSNTVMNLKKSMNNGEEKLKHGKMVKCHKLIHQFVHTETNMTKIIVQQPELQTECTLKL